MRRERGAPVTTTRLWSRRSALALLVGLPVAGFALGTSGSGAGASPAKSSRATPAQIAKTCTRVADVLSDGPDPDADPVGYALAQVLPLRQISTTDSTLQKDITNLASAYETVYETNGKKGTEAAVNKAGKKLDTICPGAF